MQQTTWEKKYQHRSDHFIEIKDDNLDAFLNCKNSCKELTQICIEVLSERISEKGDAQTDKFHVLTRIIQRNNFDIRKKLLRTW